MLGIWSMGRSLVHPFPLPSHFLPPQQLDVLVDNVGRSLLWTKLYPVSAGRSHSVEEGGAGREEGGVSCGCECACEGDWTGVVGNAVAALSLQLIVGVVLGSPDASSAGVNTWHFFTSTHAQNARSWRRPHGRVSAGPMLPPPARFWLQWPAFLLRQSYHLSFAAARQHCGFGVNHISN